MAALCPGCTAALKPLPPGLCPLCAMPLPAATNPATLTRVDAAPHPCPRCLLEPPPWSHLACATLYASTAKSLLLRYKFGNDWALTPVWGQLLARVILGLPGADMLIPMPQHPQRLRWRGANPIHEVARQTGRLLGVPVQTKALWRTRPVCPQEGLSARQRRDNPKGSFAAQGVQGCRVVLVDDVLTTGATLRHAGQCLLDAGASALHVAVIARTPLGH